MSLRQGTTFIFVAFIVLSLDSTALCQAPKDEPDIQELLRRIEAQEAELAGLKKTLKTLNPPINESPSESVLGPAENRDSDGDVGYKRVQSFDPCFEEPTDSAPAVYHFVGEEGEAADSGSPDPEDGDGVPVQDVLDDLHDRWEKQYELNDDLTDRFDSVVHPGTSLSTMRIVGRIHIDHWAFPGESPAVNAFETGDSTKGPQDRLNFRRIRFGVRGDVWENMEYRIEMEFAGANDTEFRDVWLGFNHLPLLHTVRIGNQKRPYGLDHLNSSRFNVFIERPFIIESFNQDARRLGIQSWGVSEDERYNWRFGVFNQRLIQDGGDYVSDHYQGEVAGRFANTIWYDECSDGRGYAHWAISGSLAHPDGSTPNDNGNIGPDANEARFRSRPEARSGSRWINTGRIAGADWYELLGLEGVVNVGPLQLVAEYLNVWMQRDPGFGPDLRFHGGYAYASYFLTGEHVPWNRRSGTIGRVKPFENFFLVDTCFDGVGGGWGAWQVALRLSYGDLTDQDVFGGVGESVAFGLNWYWNPNANLQFNYIYGEVSERRFVDDNGLLQKSGDYHIIGTRFRIDF